MKLNFIFITAFLAGNILILFRSYDFRRKRYMFAGFSSEKRPERRLSRWISEKFRGKRKQNAIENEIYHSASLMENIILLQKDSPKGAAYIIEQIASCSRELRPAFDSMLYYLRLNQKETAKSAFAHTAGTKSAEIYGDILIRMDQIHPGELRENVSMLRKRLREESITREKKKNEVISDLIYIPVLANVMLIFLNFIYISYYAEQKELFRQLLF